MRVCKYPHLDVYKRQIMVLEQGKIVERGDHDDLLEQKGKYYQLYHGMFELS